MAWRVILLALSAIWAGCSSQTVMIQPPSVSAAPGHTAKLSCTMSKDYYISWYQQKAGSAPVMVVDENSKRGPGIPERFSASGKGSGSVQYLTITNVQAEDEAQYYCGIWLDSVYIFGGGTQLNINTGEIKAPTLSIFPPSTEEIATQKATLVCQCQDFYPAALSWTWTVNGERISTGVGSTRPTKQTDNNLFMAGSLLSIDAIDWNADKKYTCMATHEGKTFQASVKHSECV